MKVPKITRLTSPEDLIEKSEAKDIALSCIDSDRLTETKKSSFINELESELKKSEEDIEMD